MRGPVPQRRGNSLVTVVIVLAAIIVTIYEAGRAWRQGRQVQMLTEQVESLQRERDDALARLANSSTRRGPRLPAPALQVSAHAAGASMDSGNAPSTSLYGRFKDKQPKLTAEQVNTYLTAHGRNASSLLAAYRTSGDAGFLQEAIEKFPQDPQVAFEALFAKNASPEQKRQLLNAFAQNAPDNPLANYLSARDYLKAGQADQAVQELITASGKRQFQDYTVTRRQDDEEAYLAAGYSIAEAKVLASGQVELPQLAELKQLGVQMVELANSYRTAGDESSAQVLLEMTVGLGQSYSAGDCAISHLVGMAIERIAFGAMDPNSAYGTSGHSVKEQLEQLSQQKAALASLFKGNEPIWESMSDQDWISYIDRDKMFGEEAALRWLRSKYPPK